MRANTDRAAGVRLVTDSPHLVPPVSPGHDTSVAHLDFETPALPEVVALKGRIDSGFAVQLLWSPETDETYISATLDGLNHTFPVPRDKANDAFEHPFAYGCNLAL